MRSITLRLGAAFLLLAVLCVGLMGYLTNLSVDRDFREYVERLVALYTQQAADDLGRLYVRDEGWEDVQGEVSDLAKLRVRRLVVADSSGVIVGDSGGLWLGESAEELGLHGGTPIMVSDQEMGAVYSLLPPGAGAGGDLEIPGFLGTDAAGEDFFADVADSVRVAVLVVTAAALVTGAVLVVQIARPIQSLIKGARHVAAGDLSYRTAVKTKSELGDLAESFNVMASSLERAEQSRRRLNADIAHELRTPVTIIEGTVDGILDGVFDADREHLASIKEQTALLTRLTHDLRDLSLAESGQLTLDLAPSDITDLLRRKLSQVEVRAREKDISLELNAPDGLPHVAIDSMRIEQVVANLVDNAIRHTSAGGTVRVSAEEAPGGAGGPDQQHSVVLSVSDTGKGIAAEHLPHIFDRFYRVDASRSKDEGGAGLGLAIVKQIVVAHGGRAWAESEPGTGSTFFVSLPVAVTPTA